jgi:hypothetical protein
MDPEAMRDERRERREETSGREVERVRKVREVKVVREARCWRVSKGASEWMTESRRAVIFWQFEEIVETRWERLEICERENVGTASTEEREHDAPPSSGRRPSVWRRSRRWRREDTIKGRICHGRWRGKERSKEAAERERREATAELGGRARDP